MATSRNGDKGIRFEDFTYITGCADQISGRLDIACSVVGTTASAGKTEVRVRMNLRDDLGDASAAQQLITATSNYGQPVADLSDELKAQVRAERERALRNAQKRAAAYFAALSQAMTEAVNAGVVVPVKDGAQQ